MPFVGRAADTKTDIDFVVGTAAQVAQGKAQYSSISAAIAAASAGQKIAVLDGTYAENVTVDKQLTIEGKGYASFVNGTLTFTAAGGDSHVRSLRFNGNVTIPLGADNIYVRDCWLSSTATIADLGASNSILIIQE